MAATEVFENEFNWLQSHMPEALDLQEKTTVFTTFANHFNQPITIAEPALLIERMEADIFKDPFYLLPEEGQQKMQFENEGPSNRLLDYLGEPEIEATLLDDLICEFGNDCFGLYLPMHNYYNNKHTGWGIYLFPEFINAQAAKLAKKFSKYISQKGCFLLYTYCVYRHELFHFQTELFATGMEVAMRKPLYLNYQSEIFSKLANTEDWLEEALAEASVLNSRLVSNRSRIDNHLKNLIYAHDLEKAPPGYRHYRCTKYGGPKKAMQVLAAQIMHLQVTDPLPTDLISLKSNFSVNDSKVPLYFVTGLKEITKVDRRFFR